MIALNLDALELITCILSLLLYPTASKTHMIPGIPGILFSDIHNESLPGDSNASAKIIMAQLYRPISCNSSHTAGDGSETAYHLKCPNQPAYNDLT